MFTTYFLSLSGKQGSCYWVPHYCVSLWMYDCGWICFFPLLQSKVRDVNHICSFLHFMWDLSVEIPPFHLRRSRNSLSSGCSRAHSDLRGHGGLWLSFGDMRSFYPTLMGTLRFWQIYWKIQSNIWFFNKSITALCSAAKFYYWNR